MSAHASAHRAREAGGVRRIRGRRDRADRVPADTPVERGRRSADRRPGSGAAGARGRHGLPGRRVRGAGRGRRRPRRQHQPDRLPGGLHRPLVRRPGRRHDLPARSATTAALADDDQSIRPVAPRRSSSPTPRPPSSTTPASWRRCCATTAIPAIAGVDTRALARHLRANGCLRGDRHRSRARSTATRRVDRGAGRAALGGPGLRRPGLAVVDHGRRPGGGRRAADRDRRLRPEVEHRPGDAPARAPGSGSCRTRSRPRWRSRRTSTA